MKPALTLEQLALCGGNLQWIDVCGGRIYLSIYLHILIKIYVSVRK